jgi:hypothetical protein
MVLLYYIGYDQLCNLFTVHLLLICDLLHIYTYARPIDVIDG